MNLTPLRVSLSCFSVLLFKKIIGQRVVAKENYWLKTKLHERRTFSLEKKYLRVTGKASPRKQTTKHLIFILLSRHTQCFTSNVSFISPMWWSLWPSCTKQNTGAEGKCRVEIQIQILYQSPKGCYLPSIRNNSPQGGEQCQHLYLPLPGLKLSWL